MNNLYKIHNVVRFIEYFTFNTFFWRVGMKFQTKLIDNLYFIGFIILFFGREC